MFTQLSFASVAAVVEEVGNQKVENTGKTYWKLEVIIKTINHTKTVQEIIIVAVITGINLHRQKSNSTAQ